MTRIAAPNRLHFGLLSLPSLEVDHWPGLDDCDGIPVRRFGGVGLMIDQPGIIVNASANRDWTATGPYAERALQFAKAFVAASGLREIAFAIEVERSPEEHTGLGVGTQLGLAVAKAIAIETDQSHLKSTELAIRIGRGERSAIGVYGFESGGLIVEGGKTRDEKLSPLLAQYQFPDEWAIAIFTIPSKADWHGPREQQAFVKLAQLGPTLNQTDTLCRLVLMGMLPALISRNLKVFGEALYEFNARVGDVFATAQNGRYSTADGMECVRWLRAQGINGVGQSSWGPAIFAIADRDRVANLVSGSPFQATMAFASSGAKQLI